MVLPVRAQMLGQLVDTRTEQRHLDLGGPGVAIRPPVLGDDLLLLLGSKAHARRNRSSQSDVSTYVLASRAGARASHASTMSSWRSSSPIWSRRTRIAG